MIKISLDYDDFSCLNHRFDLLDKIRDRYPNFKVTMFTIPWEIRLSPDTKGTPITSSRYAPWVERVIEAQEEGWLDISIHGLTHSPREFEELKYQEARNRIITGQKMFANRKVNVNNLFKSPQWLSSGGTKQAVKDLGLTLMNDGYYNWNLKDDMPEGDLIAHGHVQDVMGNGMEESFFRLTKIPQDAEWVFLKDMI